MYFLWVEKKKQILWGDCLLKFSWRFPICSSVETACIWICAFPNSPPSLPPSHNRKAESVGQLCQGQRPTSADQDLRQLQDIYGLFGSWCLHNFAAWYMDNM